MVQTQIDNQISDLISITEVIKNFKDSGKISDYLELFPRERLMPGTLFDSITGRVCALGAIYELYGWKWEYDENRIIKFPPSYHSTWERERKEDNLLEIAGINLEIMKGIINIFDEKSSRWHLLSRSEQLVDIDTRLRNVVSFLRKQGL